MSSPETTAKIKKAATYLLCAITGAALSLAFPDANQSDAAWFCLVPLLVMIRFSKPREGFRFGFVFGLAFWLLSLSWLMELRHNGGPVLLVTFGLIGLSTWCAMFMGLFGMAASYLWQGGDSATTGWRRSAFETGLPVVVSLLWCGTEYLRSTLLTGFAWNALGVSQTSLLPVVQVASLGGVYAVSFVIVLVNSGIAGAGVRMWRNIRGRSESSRRHLDLMLSLVVLLTVMVWGTHRIKALRLDEARADTVSIGAVNPSMPCIFVSNDDEWHAGYKALSEYTQTLGMFKPDLIVWPETVLYASMPNAQLEANVLGFAQTLGTPILAGGTELWTDGAGVEHVYNSSFLFGTNGVIEGVYRKQHLVPFGEYIPADKTLTFLQRFAPAGVSCSPGKGPVVMAIAGGTVRVSPLICFEDTVASLSRAAVKAGATILITQSNDAWFFGSSEPKQHHAQAVFRAVENGVPMVRSSNRGVTAVLTSYGASSKDAEGGFFSHPVPLVANPGGTLYSRCGDWIFGIPCALLFCGVLAVMIRNTRKRVTARSYFSGIPPRNFVPDAATGLSISDRS